MTPLGPLESTHREFVFLLKEWEGAVMYTGQEQKCEVT